MGLWIDYNNVLNTLSDLSKGVLRVAKAIKPKRTYNSYYLESFEIFKKLSKDIVDDNFSISWEKKNATLWLAIGLEKLLKGILYSINPLYILKNPEFKNSIQVFYSDKVFNNFELSKQKDEDVIAMQAAILMCIPISQSVSEHKNVLMKIKNARDIIAHHDSSSLDLDEMIITLKRDFYPFLDSLSKEFDLGGQTNFFNNLHSKLAKISSSLQENAIKALQLKITAAKSNWVTLEKTKTFNILKPKSSTLKILEKDFAFPVECPSCSNQAVVFATPIMEFDYSKKELIEVGLNVKELKCEFCSLEINDSRELDELKINLNPVDKPNIVSKYFDDISNEFV